MKMLALLFASVVSFNVFAADGSSGCGPGWYVFKENSLVSSSLRATTNGFLWPSTTIGMTIGSSNCTKHKIVKQEKESLKFASENYFEILAESSKGKGEFLQAFAHTIGCQSDSNKVFQSEMKRRMKNFKSFKDYSPSDLLKETYIMIFENKALTQSCVLAS